MTDLVFKGTVRTDLGKGASRRLRREGNIPAIVYGADKEALSIVLNHNEVLKCFRNEDIFTSIVTIEVDGKEDSAILRDVQRHPFKPLVTHLDFMRVRADEAIVVEVPIVLLNEDKAHGVVHNNGQVSQHLAAIAVSCLPKYLPNEVELDIADLKIDETLMISDIPAIPNVDFVDLMNEEELNDQAVVTISEAYVYDEEAEEEAAAESEAAAEAANEEINAESDDEE